MSGVDQSVSTVRFVKQRSAIVLAVVAAAALLGGCAQNAPQDTWQPAGETPARSRTCSCPVFLIAGIVGVIVFAVIIFVVIRFRDRGQEMPKQTHGKPALEIALTIIPAVILIGVGIPTVSTVFALAKTQRHAVRHQRHRPAVVVGVRLPGAERAGGVRDHRADRHQRRAGHPDQDPRAAAHHQQRRHPLVLDPQAQRQARRRARP